MPAKPSYCHKIADAVTVLERLRSDWIDRRQLEEILGVSKTVAWRILKRCGAEEGPGSTLVCRRTDLITRLQGLQQDGGTVEFEIRRRERLDEQLQKMRTFVQSKQVKIARDDEALQLMSTRFNKLPANVTLTRESLHLEFSGTEEFLQAMAAVVFALNNDYDAVAAFLRGESLDVNACS